MEENALQEVSVEEILRHYNLIVPEIQREYVWGYNTHNIVDVFLNDIVEGKSTKDINMKTKMENLQKIFTGEITNWKQVGGNDVDVVILNRASGSGTRGTFERWVLNGKEPKAAQEQDSSGTVRQIVAAFC